MSGEAQAFTQPETQNAPLIQAEQVLQPNRDIVDSYNDARNKAQAQLIVDLVQQNHGTHATDSDALEATVKTIVEQKRFPEPPLPTVLEAADTPIPALIEAEYANHLKEHKAIVLEKTSENTTAKNIAEISKTLSGKSDLAELVNGQWCKDYIAKAQANPSDEIVKIFPWPEKLDQQVLLLKTRYLLEYFQNNPEDEQAQAILAGNRDSISSLSKSYNSIASSNGFKTIELSKPTEHQKEIVEQIKTEGLAVENLEQSKGEMFLAAEASPIARDQKVNSANMDASASTIDTSSFTDENGNALDTDGKNSFHANLVNLLQWKAKAVWPFGFVTSIAETIPPELVKTKLNPSSMAQNDDGSVEVELVAEGVTIPLPIDTLGQMHLTDPMPLDPFAKKIQAQDVVLPDWVPPLKQYYDLVARQDFADEFAAKLQAEIKDKNITKTSEGLELAAELYPKFFEEKTKDITKGSLNLSESIGHFVQKKLLFEAANDVYPLKDGLEWKSLLDQSTPESKERVRYLGMFTNPLLKTPDYMSLTSSMRRLKVLQDEANALARTVDPDKPNANTDLLDKKLDPVIEKYNSPFNEVPPEYQGKRAIPSVERDTLANTYAGAVPDFMSLFINDEQLGFTRTDIRRFEVRTNAVTNKIPVDNLYDTMEKRGRPPKLKAFYEKPRLTALDAKLDKDLARIGNA